MHERRHAWRNRGKREKRERHSRSSIGENRLIPMSSFRIVLSTAIIHLLAVLVYAQQPYTAELYEHSVTRNIEYGTAIDYAGNDATLHLDIYIPINRYCNRPIVILVHGGAWVGGSKDDPDIVWLARSFAARGYVAATVNYRLGMHLTSNYSMYALCNENISAPCAYICDSMEVHRANFRAMQDVKGAIRFMKQRSAQDSTDAGNVFLIGQSAGGFVALTAAFMHEENERSAFCGSIADAPAPDQDLRRYGCLPASLSQSRPDLGAVAGYLHADDADAGVQGVANIFGGLLDPGIIDEAEILDKAVYMYHQGSDVVVHYGYGRLLGRLSWECFAQTNICQSYHYYPHAYGSKALAEYLAYAFPGASGVRTDIIENYRYLGNCFDNGHALDNISRRAGNIAELFAQKIASNGNTPRRECTLSTDETRIRMHISVYPNPSASLISIDVPGLRAGSAYRIMDMLGRTVQHGSLNAERSSLRVSSLPAGQYYFHLLGYQGRIFRVRRE
jgi:dienelactone hydrolase